MAKEIAFHISVDNTALQQLLKDLGSLTTLYDKLTKSQDALNGSTNQITATQEKILKVERQILAEGNKSLIAIHKQMQATKELVTLSVQKEQADKKALGTINELNAEKKRLTEAINELNLKTEGGREQFVKYKKELQLVVNQIEFYSTATKTSSAEVVKFHVSFGAAFGKVQTSLNETSSAFSELKNVSAALGMEKLADGFESTSDAIKKTGADYKAFQLVVKLGNSIIATYSSITSAIAAAKQAYTNGVKAATIAQKAFNVATKAKPIALMVGLLTAGAAAFASYKVGTDDAKESQDDFNEALRESQQILEESYDTSSMVQVNDKKNLSPGGQLPEKAPQKVEGVDTSVETRTDVIRVKAQEAGDAFGKMNEVLYLAEQISEVRLQNELARIEEKRDAEIEAVNDSVASEEDKKARIESINAKYDKQAEEKKKAAAKREKAFAITRTIIAGAQAAAQGIAQFGPPPSPPGIAALAAAAVTTATQLALIAKQKFAKGGHIPFETGGMIQGASHAQGGVPFMAGGALMEAEGGELIVNRNIWSRPDFVKNISEMNAITGGRRFFAAGGMVPTASPPAYVSSAVMPFETFDNDAMIKGLRGVIAEEVGSIKVVNNVVDTTSQQKRLFNIQTEASF